MMCDLYAYVHTCIFVYFLCPVCPPVIKPRCLPENSSDEIKPMAVCMNSIRGGGGGCIPNSIATTKQS